MDIKGYVQKMKIIQKNILNFIENDTNCEENYQNLIKLFDDQNIQDKRHELKTILHLLDHIVNNHHRTPTFLTKSERILEFLRDKIKTYFTNFEIFNIFKTNKRLLYYLFKAKIIHIDKSIIICMTKDKFLFSNYPTYFSNEFKPFISDKTIQNEMNNSLIIEITKELPKDYEEKREIGENDTFLCTLIRNDSIEEFKELIEKANLSLKSTIETSIYETNSFLIDKKPTLIEYSAFYGSIQIFNYLYLNGIELTSSLWLYSIHGRNQEILHILEGNRIESSDFTFGKCLKEAIKCHHNEIAEFICKILIGKEVEYFNIKTNFSKNIFAYCFHYYNFAFFPNTMNNDNNKFIFFYSCKYDYYTLVELLIKTQDVGLNATLIERPIY